MTLSAFARRQALRGYDRLAGRQLVRLMRELERGQWLSRAELERRQAQKLAALLDYVYRHVPYYRALFDAKGLRPAADPRNLRRLPLLTRALVRENEAALLTTEAARRASLQRRYTSGSSGEPLAFFVDKSFRDAMTALIHHHMSWGGWDPGKPYLFLGVGASGNSVPGRAESLRNRLMNWTLNRASLHLYPHSYAQLDHVARLLRTEPPFLLFGASLTMILLAQFLREHYPPAPQIPALVTTGQVFYAHERRAVAETFQATLLDQYASREVGVIALQCPAGAGYHLMTENVFVEILDEEGSPAPPGQPGQIVVTGLSNFGMPLIRYCLEDVVAWERDESPCACGRSHPRLALVFGRRLDFLQGRAGPVFLGADTLPLAQIAALRRFQIIQKSPDQIVARLVVAEEVAPETLAPVTRGLRALLENPGLEVIYEFPEEIAAGPSGKFRYILRDFTA